MDVLSDGNTKSQLMFSRSKRTKVQVPDVLHLSVFFSRERVFLVHFGETLRNRRELNSETKD